MGTIWQIKQFKEVWVNPEGNLKEELEEEITRRLEELRKDDDDDELSRDL